MKVSDNLGLFLVGGSMVKLATAQDGWFTAADIYFFYPFQAQELHIGIWESEERFHSNAAALSKLRLYTVLEKVYKLQFAKKGRAPE